MGYISHNQAFKNKYEINPSYSLSAKRISQGDPANCRIGYFRSKYMSPGSKGAFLKPLTLQLWTSQLAKVSKEKTSAIF